MYKIVLYPIPITEHFTSTNYVGFDKSIGVCTGNKLHWDQTLEKGIVEIKITSENDDTTGVV